MVETNYKDGLVQLFLDDELKLESASVNGVTIGTYVEYEDVTVEKKDYDTALAGKDASLTFIEVMADGYISVDAGGKVTNINVNGGTLSGSPLCENARGYYGAAICLTSSDYTAAGTGALLITGGTFTNCAVNPSGGWLGHGGAIETYCGTLSVTDSLFIGNCADGTEFPPEGTTEQGRFLSGAAGGALALLYSTNTVTGGTFSGNSAYFGGAIQQNSGTLTVTGTLFTGNFTSGDVTSDHPTGNAGGAVELHNGATASITGSTFSGNYSRSGGAIYSDTFNKLVSEAAVTGSTFSDNAADYQGGAIYNYASMTVSNSVFTGNKVTDEETDPFKSRAFGGAIANTDNGTMTVTGGSFTGNTAFSGGAVATFIEYGAAGTADFTVKDAAFLNNTASYAGGGLYIQVVTEEAISVIGAEFSGNTAGYAGGAICQSWGTMAVAGGIFTSNSAANDGGAIAIWDYLENATAISDAEFTSNTALYGGAISHSYSAAPLDISGCMFTGNGGATTAQGGAIWNNWTDYGPNGVVTISGCTFSGNAARQGGAVYNDGNMKLEDVTLATESDTVFNGGSLAFAGANKLAADVVNDGKITFSVSGGDNALVDDLGKFSGSGTYLLKLAAEAASSGAAFAASAGTFSGSLSVKLGDVASSDSFTLDGGVIGNDLAVAGETVLRLKEAEGALSVKTEALENLVPAVSKDGSILVWTDDAAPEAGFLVEIASGGSFDAAIRIATDGTAFDVAGRAGDYSCRTARADGAFTADSASWTDADASPRQVASGANGRADVFFAQVSANDVWTAEYQARNLITGECVAIAGKNRVRDTFSGSASDANILYLSDTDNGDALFMDDIYSEFGDSARLNLIREVRAGAGDDVVDMTSERYTAELAGMTVRGGDGDDVLWGASGGNSLFGDAGNDRIAGGSGDDVIAGGAGNDVLHGGGGGNDVFTFGENWGADTVEQFADGSVTLWFESGDIANWNAETLTYADGNNSVTVSGVAADKVTLKFGSDKSEQFNALSAAGAFLGSTTEAVFETEAARTNGILASL